MTATRFFKILPFLVLTGISSASPIPDFPFIVADGRVEREIPPTNATINFTVLAFAKSAEESTDEVQSSLGKVIAALKAEGVKDDMISAHDLAKNAVRDRAKDLYQETDIQGYEISRQVELKLPDLGNYPKVIRVLMTADHITRLDSDFDTDKRDEVEALLVSEACVKARKKADLLAKATGVGIDKVYSVTTGDFVNVGERFGFSNGVSSGVFGGSTEDLKIPLFVPTSITLRASVNILYKLAP